MVDATNPLRPFEPKAVALLSNLVGADRDACYYEFDHHTHATSHVAEHQAVEMPGDIETARALCRVYPGRPFEQQARGLLELLRPYLTRLRQRWERSTEPGGLTNREGEVVRLLATGMRNREIADHLTISVGTSEHISTTPTRSSA